MPDRVIHHMPESARHALAAGFAVGVPTASWIVNINAYLATASFVVGIVLGLLGIWQKIKPKK